MSITKLAPALAAVALVGCNATAPKAPDTPDARTAAPAATASQPAAKPKAGVQWGSTECKDKLTAVENAALGTARNALLSAGGADGKCVAVKVSDSRKGVAKSIAAFALISTPNCGVATSETTSKAAGFLGGLVDSATSQRSAMGTHAAGTTLGADAKAAKQACDADMAKIRSLIGSKGISLISQFETENPASKGYATITYHTNTTEALRNQLVPNVK